MERKSHLWLIIATLLIILAGCAEAAPPVEGSEEIQSESSAEEVSDEDSSVFDPSETQIVEMPGEEPYTVKEIEEGQLAYNVSQEILIKDLNTVFSAEDLDAIVLSDLTIDEEVDFVIYTYCAKEETPFLTVIASEKADNEQVIQISINPVFLENAGDEELAKRYLLAALEFFSPGKSDEILELGTIEAENWPSFQYGNTLISFSPIGNIDLFPAS